MNDPQSFAEDLTVMGKLLIANTRRVVRGIQNLEVSTHPQIFEDSSGSALLSYIEGLEPYKTDVRDMQEHAKKHNIYPEDPRCKESINNYKEQLLCSVWLNNVDKYRNSLLNTDWFAQTFIDKCFDPSRNYSNTYTMGEDLLMRFNNIIAGEIYVCLERKDYPGFSGFSFYQDYEASSIAQLAFNAQNTFRNSLSEERRFAHIISSFFTGLNTGIRRFIPAFESFKTKPYQFNSWKAVVAELHREAKANIYNVRANGEITIDEDSTYKFGQTLVPRHGPFATVGCTAGATFSFFRFGLDIPRYIQIIDEYLLKQQGV